MNLAKILQKFVGYIDIEEIEQIIKHKEYFIIKDIYTIEDLASEAISLNRYLPFDIEDLEPEVDLCNIGNELLKNDWYIDYENNLGICIPEYIQ